MLITLRFAQEIKPQDELDLPAGQAKAVKVSPREVAMAKRLVEEMSAPWRPQDYHDTYREDLMRRIQEKIRNKQTHVLTPKEKQPKEEGKSAEVIDLMSVLRRSLESRRGAAQTRPSRRVSAARRRRRA